jgi:hypothetical protein
MVLSLTNGEKLELKNTIIMLQEDLPHLLGIFKFYRFTE